MEIQTQPCEDSVPLRSYILALFDWWPLLVIMAILAGSAAGLYSLRAKPVYETKAGIVITPSRWPVNCPALKPRSYRMPAQCA